MTKYKFFTFFAMLYMMFAITDMILIYRMGTVGVYTISVGVFVMSLLYLTEDIIAEVYGYKVVRQVIWTMLLISFIFSSIVTILNALPFPDGWQNKPAFDLILGHVFRINLYGGGLALMGGAFLNAYIITKWKILVRGKYFILRCIGATAIGQLIQNIIGCFVLYFDIYSMHQILDMIIPMYLTQMAFNIIIAFPGSILARFLKKAENSDPYDDKTNFNPFKYSV